MTKRTVSALLSWCAFSLPFLNGCADSPRPVVHDLSELLPRARVVTATTLLDFGTGAIRPNLMTGWSLDETATDGTSFVWAVGEKSSLEFFVGQSEPRALVFRAWPFHFETAPRQVVRLRLNDEDAGEVPLEPSPAEYRVALSPTALRPGKNDLELLFAYHRAPSEVFAQASDPRQLAVGFDWLRFDGAPAADAPQASGAGDGATLVIPSSVELEYYVDAPPDSLLTIDFVRALNRTGETSPDPAPLLRVRYGTVEGDRERILGADSRDVRIPLPPRGGLVRLSLEAPTVGVVLRSPKVRSSAAARSQEAAAAEVRPDIILIVVDTLRADHLGCYGYPKPVSPHLDALAKEGTLFENAIAQSSWTRPSVASMMTGLLPRAHLANRRGDALPAGVRTLAEALAELGYETAGFVTNTNVAAAFGFDQGFTTYELLLDPDPRLGYARADELVQRARRFLDEPRSGPRFLYLHATDPHDPYSFTERSGDGVGTMTFMKSLENGEVESTPSLRDELLELYDREIGFADAELGKLFGYLKERDLYDDALIMVLSDHGEEFGDHGWWRHGKTLYQEQLHVPWLVKWPKGAGAGIRLPGPAQHIDLMPTVLDYLGAPSTKEELGGRSLWRLVRGGDDASAVAAESYLALDGRELESVYLDGEKVVRYYTYDRDKPAFELFDLTADPSESRSLAATEAPRLDFLNGLLRLPFELSDVAATPAAIDKDLERRLRALGYIP